MTRRIFALVPAMVLTLATETALAQHAMRPDGQFDRANLVYRHAPLGVYGLGGAVTLDAAFLGDGGAPSYLKDKQQLMQEPGYTIGTGAAEIDAAPAQAADGSDPSRRQDQRPLQGGAGYSLGGAAAQVSGSA